MNCKDASALISRSMDSTLNVVDKARLYLHLRRCGDCKTLKANFRAIRRGCHAMVSKSPTKVIDIGK